MHSRIFILSKEPDPIHDKTEWELSSHLDHYCDYVDENTNLADDVDWLKKVYDLHKVEEKDGIFILDYKEVYKAVLEEQQANMNETRRKLRDILDKGELVSDLSYIGNYVLCAKSGFWACTTGHDTWTEPFGITIARATFKDKVYVIDSFDYHN